jgi:ATP-dependent RNA helicase DeaD
VDTDQNTKSAALFEHLNVPSQLLESLTKNNFVTPTQIQQEVIPIALNGVDVLGSAQTGTGKTLAFAIPLLARLLAHPTECALIVAPTRELAMQIQQSLHTLIGRDLRIFTALLIGGEPIFKQFRQLRSNPRIVVGTPGRIIDHLQQESYRTDRVKFLVLDEMDRMFDMGFDQQIAEIIKRLDTDRQTLMFSATLSKEIEQRAQKYLRSPVRISVGPANMPAANIKQEVVHVNEGGKFEALVVQLNQREGSVIIFVKTKMGAARLADRLTEENHPALAMHGDLRQRKREQVVLTFKRGGRQRIMVATDIAARGLDIPHIQHVINYDLPQDPGDYVHRIGRTARAGASGSAVCFIAPHERRLWDAIDRMLNPVAGMPAGDFKRPSYGRGGGSGGDRRGGFGGGGRRGGSSGGNRRDSFSGPRGGGFGGGRRDERSSGFGSRQVVEKTSFFDSSARDTSGSSATTGDQATRPQRTSRPFTPRANRDSNSRNDAGAGAGSSFGRRRSSGGYEKPRW